MTLHGAWLALATLTHVTNCANGNQGIAVLDVFDSSGEALRLRFSDFRRNDKPGFGGVCHVDLCTLANEGRVFPNQKPPWGGGNNGLCSDGTAGICSSAFQALSEMVPISYATGCIGEFTYAVDAKESVWSSSAYTLSSGKIEAGHRGYFVIPPNPLFITPDCQPGPSVVAALQQQQAPVVEGAKLEPIGDVENLEREREQHRQGEELRRRKEEQRGQEREQREQQRREQQQQRQQQQQQQQQQHEQEESQHQHQHQQHQQQTHDHGVHDDHGHSHDHFESHDEEEQPIVVVIGSLIIILVIAFAVFSVFNGSDDGNQGNGGGAYTSSTSSSSFSNTSGLRSRKGLQT